MCTKTLQICIFSIAIIILRGDSLHPSGLEDEQPIIETTYDEPQIDPENAELFSENKKDTENESQFSENQNVPDEVDSAVEDSGPIEQPEEENDEDGGIFSSDYEYEELVPKHSPRSNEILDRNTPEAGFDLSYDEMMKLKLWPDGLIPYYIDVHSFSDKVMRDRIRSFLSSVNSLTSLNFVELPSPPNDDSRWVIFINRRGLLGCADHSIRNFTNTGVQRVVLGYHCMSTEGELAEAVMAIAGVPAQHNSPDRDYYIKINEENIIPEKKYLFEKRMDNEWLFHDIEYDFKSVGHFHSYKHSVNGRPTLEPQKQTGDITLGESNQLSASDILKIRMLYNYIVKKKLLQAPDCHKLFEPGKKFRYYKPSDNNLKPRPKPFRYTREAPDAPLETDDFVGAPDNNQNGYEDTGAFNGEIPNENIQFKNDMNIADLNVNDGAFVTNYESFDKNNGAFDMTNGGSNNVGNQMPVANEGQMIPNVQNQGQIEDHNYDNFDIPDTAENHPPDYSNTLPVIHEESDNDFQDFNNKKKRATIVNIHKSQFQPVTNKYGALAQSAGFKPPEDKPPEHLINLIQPLKHIVKSLKVSSKKRNKKEDLLSALSDYQTDEEKRYKGGIQRQVLKFRGLRGTKIIKGQ